MIAAKLFHFVLGAEDGMRLCVSGYPASRLVERVPISQAAVRLASGTVVAAPCVGMADRDVATVPFPRVFLGSA